MPLYLFIGRYSVESIKSMVGKPQDREAAAGKLAEAAGGRLHHLYFGFGEDDVYALIEAPDDGAMAAIALAVGASGALSSGRTVKLLTAQEAMSAMGSAKDAMKAYTPPTG